MMFPWPFYVHLPRTHAVLGEKPFDADRTGVKDATQALQNALDDSPSVEIPPGSRFRISHLQDVKTRAGTEHAGAIVRQSGRKLWGHGPSSRLVTVLDDPTTPETAEDATLPNAISWLFLAAGLTSFEATDFWCEGEAPSGLDHPDKFHTNLQMACIDAGLNEGNTPAASGVRIRRVGFERQYGFSAHCRGLGNDWVTERCEMIDCMNGSNINADDSDHTYNHVTRSEGFEHSGSRVQIAHNLFRKVHGAGIAYGGHTGMGTHENRSYGGSVVHNIVDECDGTGYQITVNVSDCDVSHNYASRTRRAGIDVGGGGSDSVVKQNRARNVLIESNRMLDCGREGELFAMRLAGVVGAKIRGNWARHGEYAEQNQLVGLSIGQSKDIAIGPDNDFRGRMHDLMISLDSDVRLPDHWDSDGIRVERR